MRKAVTITRILLLLSLVFAVGFVGICDAQTLIRRPMYATGGGGGGSLSLGTPVGFSFADDSNSINLGNFNATTGGANAMLLVTMSGYSDWTNHIPATVTYNGVSMTLVGSGQTGASSGISVWYLASPASGSNAIVIADASGSSMYGQAVAIPVLNSNTSDPYRTAASASGAHAGTVASTTYTSATGELWMGFAGNDKQSGASTLTPGSGTEIYNHNDGPDSLIGTVISIVTQPGSGSVSAVTWTLSINQYRTAMWFSLK